MTFTDVNPAISIAWRPTLLGSENCPMQTKQAGAMVVPVTVPDIEAINLVGRVFSGAI